MTETSTFVDPIAHGWMGAELADYLFDGRYPQDTGEWLKFFEHLTTLYDRTGGKVEQETKTFVRNGKEYEAPLVGVAVSKMLTPESRAFIRRLVEAGKPSPEIRAEVQRAFGVEISASYMSQLRKRLVPKATNL